MSATVYEHAETGPFGTQRAERNFVIQFPDNETPTDAAAKAALVTAAGASYLDIPFSECEVTPVAGNPRLYFGRASYNVSADSGSGDTYADVLQGSTRGARQTITQSLATTKYPTATAPDEGGAIGYDGETVKGVEIDVPTAQWSKTKRVANASVFAFFETCRAATGLVNNATFQGNAAGCIKFLGADFSRQDNDYGYFTLSYAFSPNQTGLTIGGITGVDKLGWDVIDVRYEDVVDATSKSILKKPKYVYIHQVYPRGTLPE